MKADFRLLERDGIDTLHRWPANEADNLDDTDRDRALPISEDQAKELIRSGSVLPCRRCFPELHGGEA